MAKADMRQGLRGTRPPVFTCLKLPRRLRGTLVDLHRLTLCDGPFLKEFLSGTPTPDNYMSKASGQANWLDLWWWARKEYICTYTIRHRQRRIGLVGLHGFDSTGSIEMTLTILPQEERGKGCGTDTFQLFLRSMLQTDAVRQIVVRVDPSDARTLHFWERMGFRRAAQEEPAILLRQLSPVISSPPEEVFSSPSERPHR